MRLVTRSDFDGLACGVLLKEAGIIDHWKFAHPKDLQDGLVEIDENGTIHAIGGGGEESGTKDYENLSNKPSGLPSE